MVNRLSASSVPDAVYAGHLFPLLNPRDLASLGTADHRLQRCVSQFVAMHFQGPSLQRIIAEYGFAPLGNVRNLTVLARAYEVCHFEGEGEGLSKETLGAKMQVVEDRNLVKMFLRCNKIPVLPSVEVLAYTHFLRKHPELMSCCIANVKDIPLAARSLREMLQNGDPIPMMWIQFNPLDETDGVRHFHDRDISIIPPEICYFRAPSVHMGCRLWLVSEKLAITFTGPQGANKLLTPIILMTSANQRETLKAIPNQVLNLERLRINGAAVTL